MQGEPANTRGFDACVDTSPYIGGLNAAGVDFVIRYIGNTPAWAGKYVSVAEAVALALAGIKLALVYETTGRPSGSGVGAVDGRYAADIAASLGIRPNTGAVIEYTEDKDTVASEIPGIAAAFQAFRHAVAPGYGVGSYGGGYCNAAMAARGLIKVRWLTCSQGFNGTKEAIDSGDYDVIQRLPTNVRINGGVINVDPDSLHVANGDIGARVPWGGAIPKGAPLNFISVQLLLNRAGQTPQLGVDDVGGNATTAAIKAYQQRLGLSVDGVVGWDETAPSLCKDAGVTVLT